MCVRAVSVPHLLERGKDMSFYFGHRTVVICIALLSLGLVLSCDDDYDNPVNPIPGGEYYVYFADEQAPNTFFRYHTGTMELDSFHLPYVLGEDGFGISPDGKTMYLHPDMGIAEVSLESLTVIAEHPIDIPKGMLAYPGHQVKVSPDGQYLAILNPYLHIVRLADYSIIYADTQAVYLSGTFTADAQSFLTPRLGVSPAVVREIALGDPVGVRDHDFGGVYPWRVVATSDNSQWFVLMGITTCYDQFRAYAMPSESLLFSLDINHGHGDLVVTPDDRHAIHTQQPLTHSLPRVFVFYDIDSRQIDRVVPSVPDSASMPVATDQMCVSPDGGHLFGTGPQVGQFVDYDLRGDSIRKYIALADGMFHAFGLVTCQSRP